ncbi:MAG: thioredoxin-dependent thiol peroxidase [Bdellovibrionota bacterium]
MAKSLEEGDKAPAFKLKDQDGNTVSLSDFKGQNVVLYFYPKDLTPGCTQEACDFRDNFARLKKGKTAVLGVSKDSEALHQKFIKKHDLNFPLLADVDGKACEAYGVWKEKSMYGKKYMGIERTTFIIGSDQKIKKIYPKVKVNGHVDQILEDLKGI